MASSSALYRILIDVTACICARLNTYRPQTPLIEPQRLLLCLQFEAEEAFDFEPPDFSDQCIAVFRANRDSAPTVNLLLDWLASEFPDGQFQYEWLESVRKIEELGGDGVSGHVLFLPRWGIEHWWDLCDAVAEGLRRNGRMIGKSPFEDFGAWYYWDMAGHVEAFRQMLDLFMPYVDEEVCAQYVADLRTEYEAAPYEDDWNG
ncbi:hypothetical protein BJ508DRAFT_323183 [Ascobolus immersus RN42]|uniref:Uncharacterized protein n=1 Tax=Ascobolus immersus RN42 TaxID=1160509 RepID=A0A3N4IH91_ASCIM|nr:hypothetical protein BJ508DRAFT_323183 [Ascobolus immersus RN42]